LQKSAQNTQPEPADSSAASTSKNTIQVGIDWADKEHAYSSLLPSGKIKTGSFKQSKTGIEEWIAELFKLAPDCNIDICIETSSGALINALMEYPQVRIFPVNPLALANYRKAFAPGGGKNDPVDARLIMQFLQHYRAQLRQLIPNSPETRELTALAQDRRLFVEQRVALSNRMMAYLKAYFPKILELKPARAYSEFVVRLVHAYPTLEEAQKAGKVKLRKILFGTGAPITTQSGNSRFVSARWSSSKFIKQTFHEYAGLSIAKCAWAKAYYEEQIAKGKSAQMAKRALAFKWIRIIFRLWQARISYDDSHYVARLNKTGSPLAQKLKTAAE
jgi:hypothetical protein